MSDHPAREEVHAHVAAAVAPILNELRWQRWLIGVLTAATLLPKLGGPSAPEMASRLLEASARAAGGG